MKDKILNFLKAFSAFIVILLFLFLVISSVIAELFPTAIPDWMYTVFAIIGIPFAIAFFVVIVKEWRKQRRAKKSQKKK